MKLAFIASFIIGGLLWLSVFQVNNNMFSHSGRQTLYQSVKVTNEAFAQLMERDLRRVGFGVSGHGILIADTTRFSFEADFTNSGITQTVTWTTEEIDISEDRVETVFNRTGPDADAAIQNRDYQIGARDFRFRYYDRHRNITTEVDSIRHIGFIMLSESEQRYGDRFERHALERTVTPRNLNLGS
ncbi:MAG: hypothetical protein LAT84_03070 [Balneolia bacterium]|nr:hypothetical protein [Balneolia bacterium]